MIKCAECKFMKQHQNNNGSHYYDCEISLPIGMMVPKDERTIYLPDRTGCDLGVEAGFYEMKRRDQNK